MPVYFHLAIQPLPITLESIGNQWLQPPVRRINGYPYYHWLQTEKGSGRIKINQHDYLLTTGHGILIPAFMPHEYFPEGEWVVNFATFEGTLAPTFDHLLQTNLPILVTDHDFFSFSHHINRMITMFSQTELNSFKLSQLCYEFFLQLSQEASHYSHSNHPAFKSYVDPTIKEIETHYAEIISINQLAEKLFISPQYLNRLFKQFVQTSPYQYLLSFRINKAKELLINRKELSIQSIAHQTGFQSPSQFSLLFKQQTQLTPKEFRQLHFLP